MITSISLSAAIVEFRHPFRKIPAIWLTEVSGGDFVGHDAVGPPVLLVDEAVAGLAGDSGDVSFKKLSQFLGVHRVGRLPVGYSLPRELALCGIIQLVTCLRILNMVQFTPMAEWSFREVLLLRDVVRNKWTVTCHSLLVF